MSVPDIEDCDKVVCAERGPIPMELEAGKEYFYCTCGRSKNQPFCDGSHQGTSFQPMKVSYEETKTVYFCRCKQSAALPVCDGSHSKLPQDAKGKLFAPAV